MEHQSEVLQILITRDMMALYHGIKPHTSHNRSLEGGVVQNKLKLAHNIKIDGTVPVAPYQF